MDKYHRQRLEHMREILDMIQGKSRQAVPPEIESLVKEKLDGRVDIPSVRQILKELKLFKYYENAHEIYASITDTPIFELPFELEEELLEMFSRVLFAWDEIRQPHESFLPYLFVLKQLLQLQNIEELVPLCSVCETKRARYSERWRQICQMLNWDYLEQGA